MDDANEYGGDAVMHDEYDEPDPMGRDDVSGEGLQPSIFVTSLTNLI